MSDSKIARSKPQGPLKLLLFCCECGSKVEAAYEGEKVSALSLYREHGWILSAVNPERTLLAPLCVPCAERTYDPALLAEARRSMSKGIS